MKSCPIGRCEEPVPDDKVMCRAHWFLVPGKLRTEVWRAYHQWERHREDRGRLDELREQQRLAIAAVEAALATGSSSRSES